MVLFFVYAHFFPKCCTTTNFERSSRIKEHKATNYRIDNVSVLFFTYKAVTFYHTTSIPGPFLELGREKALASAGHMTPRISGCKNMLISVVSVSVCINNKSEK